MHPRRVFLGLCLVTAVFMRPVSGEIITVTSLNGSATGETFQSVDWDDATTPSDDRGSYTTTLTSTGGFGFSVSTRDYDSQAAYDGGVTYAGDGELDSVDVVGTGTHTVTFTGTQEVTRALIFRPPDPQSIWSDPRFRPL